MEVYYHGNRLSSFRAQAPSSVIGDTGWASGAPLAAIPAEETDAHAGCGAEQDQGCQPSFAVGESMIAASQAQGQMLTNAVANQQKTNLVGLTATSLMPSFASCGASRRKMRIMT